MSNLRKFIQRRKLTCFAFAILIGCLLGLNVGLSAEAFFALALVPVLAFISLLIAKKRITLILLLSLALVFAGYARLASERPSNLPTGKLDIEGTICDKAEYRDDYHYISFTLNNVSLNGADFGEKIRVSVYNTSDVSLFPHGRTLRLNNASVTVPNSRKNPNGFDYAAYLWKDSIALRASASLKNIESISDRDTLLRRLYAASDSMSIQIDNLYKHNPNIMKALLLGDRSGLSQDTYSDFKDTGIAHLIALSGLHVTCMALLIELLLCLILIPRRAAVFITTAALILYALMTGMSASIVRAVIMYAALCLSREFGYSSDTLTRLSIAFTIQVCINPLVITDASFQLSYITVFSLSAISDLFMIRRRRSGFAGAAAHEVGSLFASTAAAQAGALPFMASLYNSVPIYAVFANVLTLPIAMTTLYLGALSLGISFASLRVGAFLATIADGVWSGILRLCAFVADLPFAVYSMRSWHFIEALCFYAALMAISAFTGFKKSLRRWGAAALLSVALIVCLTPAKAPDGLTITFLDVGNGDAAVVNARGNTYVIDCGHSSGICADYLLSTVSDVKGIFVSHADADHSGGLNEVLKNYKSAVVYLPECWNDMDVGDDTESALKSASVAYLSAGDRIELDYDIYAEVLWPFEGFVPSDDNDGSLVIKIVYGEASALFMGDLSEPLDIMIAADCEVLKVSHHGSKSATSTEFVKKVTPEISVISVGANSYGHPSEDVIGRLSDSVILRTDQNGAIMIEMMPNGDIEYTTADGAKGTYIWRS